MDKSLASPYRLARHTALCYYSTSLQNDPKSVKLFLDLLLTSSDQFIVENVHNALLEAISKKNTLVIKSVLTFVAASISAFSDDKLHFAVALLYESLKAIHKEENCKEDLHPLGICLFAGTKALHCLAQVWKEDERNMSSEWKEFLISFLFHLLKEKSDIGLVLCDLIATLRLNDDLLLQKFLKSLSISNFFEGSFGMKIMNSFDCKLSNSSYQLLIHILTEGIDLNRWNQSAILLEFLCCNSNQFSLITHSLFQQSLAYILCMSNSPKLSQIIVEWLEKHLEEISIEMWMIFKCVLIMCLFFGGLGMSSRLEALISVDFSFKPRAVSFIGAESPLFNEQPGRLLWIVDLLSLDFDEISSVDLDAESTNSILFVFATFFSRGNLDVCNAILSTSTNPILFNSFPLVLFRMSEMGLKSFSIDDESILKLIKSLVLFCKDEFTLNKILLILDEFSIDKHCLLRIYYEIWCKFNKIFPKIKSLILCSLNDKITVPMQISIALTMKEVAEKRAIEQSEQLLSLCSSYLHASSKFEDLSLLALSLIIETFSELCKQRIVNALNCKSFLLDKYKDVPFWRLRCQLMKFCSHFTIQNEEDLQQVEFYGECKNYILNGLRCDGGDERVFKAACECAVKLEFSAEERIEIASLLTQHSNQEELIVLIAKLVDDEVNSMSKTSFVSRPKAQSAIDSAFANLKADLNEAKRTVLFPMLPIISFDSSMTGLQEGERVFKNFLDAALMESLGMRDDCATWFYHHNALANWTQFIRKYSKLLCMKRDADISAVMKDLFKQAMLKLETKSSTSPVLTANILLLLSAICVVMKEMGIVESESFCKEFLLKLKSEAASSEAPHFLLWGWNSDEVKEAFYTALGEASVMTDSLEDKKQVYTYLLSCKAESWNLLALLRAMQKSEAHAFIEDICMHSNVGFSVICAFFVKTLYSLYASKEFESFVLATLAGDVFDERYFGCLFFQIKRELGNADAKNTLSKSYEKMKKVPSRFSGLLEIAMLEYFASISCSPCNSLSDFCTMNPLLSSAIELNISILFNPLSMKFFDQIDVAKKEALLQSICEAIKFNLEKDNRRLDESSKRQRESNKAWGFICIGLACQFNDNYRGVGTDQLSYTVMNEESATEITEGVLGMLLDSLRNNSLLPLKVLQKCQRVPVINWSFLPKSTESLAFALLHCQRKSASCITISNSLLSIASHVIHDQLKQGSCLHLKQFNALLSIDASVEFKKLLLQKLFSYAHEQCNPIVVKQILSSFSYDKDFMSLASIAEHRDFIGYLRQGNLDLFCVLVKNSTDASAFKRLDDSLLSFDILLVAAYFAKISEIDLISQMESSDLALPVMTAILKRKRPRSLSFLMSLLDECIISKEQEKLHLLIQLVNVFFVAVMEKDLSFVSFHSGCMPHFEFVSQEAILVSQFKLRNVDFFKRAFLSSINSSEALEKIQKRLFLLGI